MKYVRRTDELQCTKEKLNDYIEMYKNGFIRLTEEILPKPVMMLDKDISKSIQN